MPDLRQTRQKLKIAIAALVLVDVLALVVLFTPIAGSADSRQAQMTELNRQRKERAVAPWRGLDKKIPIAKQQIDDFFQNRLPAQESEISAELGKVSAQTGVRVASVKYMDKDTDISGLQRIEITADVSGDYVPLMKFLNTLERDKLFFIVDDVGLQSEQSGNVKLEIKVETYLRTA